MRSRLITELVSAPNLDYVESFQTLSALNLEMRRQGPSAPLLLRKAILEMGCGNYAACLSAALDAAAMEPLSAETHHQVGSAYFLLALARSGAVPAGPGHAHEDQPAIVLLSKSIDSFRQSIRLNPGDEEADADLAILEQLQRDADTEHKLIQALRRSVK